MGDFSKSLGKRILNTGSSFGYCVICGEYSKLTRDHVPPKGCNNLNDVELNVLLPSQKYSKIGTTSQGGAHYKTLCGTCNNTCLGGYYDPELVKLSNDITTLVLGAKSKTISLPESIYPFIKPQRIARSVVGHVLAANAVEETKKWPVEAPMRAAMREYFLDSSKDLPDQLDIYYWLYPSRKQVVVKGMGKLVISLSRNIVGDVIKFLPLGFWLVWDKPKDLNINLPRLVPNKNMGVDEVMQIKLNLYDVLPIDFPEKPFDDEAIALNTDHAVIATQKKSDHY